MLSLLRFLVLYVLVTILRIGDTVLLFFTQSKRPLVKGVKVERIRIPSRDPKRFITALRYTPEGASNPLPPYLSFQASGYMMKRLGIDQYMHSLFCKTLNMAVIDVAYRKSPEHKFPAAFDDAEDAVTFVLANPEQFQTNKLVVGGSSAGGALALHITSHFYPKIKGCFALYAPTMAVAGQKRSAPNAFYHSGIVLDRLAYKLIALVNFHHPEMYQDSRFNALKTDMARFPDHMLLACGDADNLYNDSRLFYKKVESEGSPAQRANIQFLSVANEAHEFNNMPRHKESFVARDRLYNAAMDMIRAAQQSA